MRLNFFFDVKRKELILVCLLFLNFFLIILTYYISKPVRSALVVTDLGSKALPYIWIIGSVVLGLFVSLYSKGVDKFRRDHLIALTLGSSMICVLAIRGLSMYHLPWLSAVFYMWSDVFSVIAVEQFWSFCNDLFDTNQAKRLYGIIGGGGILGGVFGSAMTDYLVPFVGTHNLLYVCVLVLLAVIALTYAVQYTATRNHLTENGSETLAPIKQTEVALLDSFKMVGLNPYLRRILIFVLMTQAVSNIIDYQFNLNLEKQFLGMDDKTIFISQFYFWLNLFSFIVVSVAITPLQRTIGILGSLLVLPGVDCFGMGVLLLAPSATVVYGMKFFDKALNYSISRVSKEMLYIPTTKEAKYKAKAVIDMFAFRFSKLISFSIIVPFTTVFPFVLFNYVSLLLMVALLFVAWRLGLDYKAIMHDEEKSIFGAKIATGKEQSSLSEKALGTR